MSVFRTTHPGDTFTAAIPGADPVVITSSGTSVPDEHDGTVRVQAAAAGVVLVEGGVPVAAPGSTVGARVAAVEGALATFPAPLTEQPLLAADGPVWPTVRSGQTVPVSMTAAAGPRTLVLEPGGTRSRLAVRLDADSPAGHTLTLAGTGSDVVPAQPLLTAGTIVFLEGITGGGGWRVVSRIDGGGATVPWTSITGRPTVPTQLSQLGGQVTDDQVPAAFTRDTELDSAVTALNTAISGRATSGHTHPGYASSGHTHTFPRTLGPYSPSSYSALASGSSGRTAASVVVPDPGFDWTPQAFGQLEARCGAGSRTAVGVYRTSYAAANMIAHGAGLDPVNQGAGGNGYWMVPSIPWYPAAGAPVIAAGASTQARTFLLCPLVDYGSANIECTNFYAHLQVWVIPA